MPRGYIHTAETLFKKVRKTKNGCWNFTGPICKKSGYGKIGYKGKVTNAHRLAWLLLNGEIMSGLFVCHKCDNRKCINPDHLFIGTAYDNVQDMIRKGRAKHWGGKKRFLIIGNKCSHGHLLTSETLREDKKSGNRRCIVCTSAKNLSYYYQRKNK